MWRARRALSSILWCGTARFSGIKMARHLTIECEEANGMAHAPQPRWAGVEDRAGGRERERRGGEASAQG